MPEGDVTAGLLGPDNARALAGLAAIVVLAWGMGALRHGLVRPSARLIVGAIALQFLLAWALFWFEPARRIMMQATALVEALMGATRAGTSFVFGYLGGGEAPFEVTGAPGAMVTLAFQILPLVILVSALSAVLWRWRVLPMITQGFAMAFRRVLGLSGAASLGVAANIIMGMVEAPILVRPHLARMSRSELFILMTAGLATVAGTVLALYAFLLRDVLPDAAGHVIVASIMSAPAAVLIARLMEPETAARPSRGADTQDAGAIGASGYGSTLDALTGGVTEGLKLYLNIVAMLLTFVALVALANMMLGAAPDIGGAPLTLERLFGWAFAPAMWLMGIEWSEAQTAGSLFGVKTVLNELLAFQQLSVAAAVGDVSPRTTLIMTYALCGFANFGSLGIMIAGLATMAPDRRQEILDLAPLALVSGSLATMATGCVVAALPASLFGL